MFLLFLFSFSASIAMQNKFQHNKWCLKMSNLVITVNGSNNKL